MVRPLQQRRFAQRANGGRSMQPRHQGQSSELPFGWRANISRTPTTRRVTRYGWPSCASGTRLAATQSAIPGTSAANSGGLMPRVQHPRLLGRENQAGSAGASVHGRSTAIFSADRGNPRRSALTSSCSRRIAPSPKRAGSALGAFSRSTTKRAGRKQYCFQPPSTGYPVDPSSSVAGVNAALMRDA